MRLRAEATQDKRWPREAKDEAAHLPVQCSSGCGPNPRRRKPGEELWAKIWRRNLDGSEPRYYLSNAPEGTTLETLAYVGGSRWRIETEFETEKGDVGLDEYETRSWAGKAIYHIASVPAGDWGVPAEAMQQDWGKKHCPETSRGHRCTGWCGRCMPRSSSGPINCCCGQWRIRSYATNGARRFPRETAAPLLPCDLQDGGLTGLKAQSLYVLGGLQ